MTVECYALLTFIIYNVILLVEKEGIEPKRQTSSNRRAPACLAIAPGKAGLFAEVNSAGRQSRASCTIRYREGRLLRLKILKRIISGKFA